MEYYFGKSKVVAAGRSSGEKKSLHQSITPLLFVTLGPGGGVRILIGVTIWGNDLEIVTPNRLEIVTPNRYSGFIYVTQSTQHLPEYAWRFFAFLFFYSGLFLRNQKMRRVHIFVWYKV